MNSKIQKTSPVLTLSTSLLLATYARAGQEQFLPRSLYIPINFTLCEHWHGVLYEGEQAVAVMPTKRVFQFAYYPVLKRIVPDVVQIRVDGFYVDNGEPFVARLAVTPFGIHTANRQVALDYSEPLQRLRFKIDARYQLVSLRIRCDTICSKSKRNKTEADDEKDGPSEVHDH